MDKNYGSEGAYCLGFALLCEVPCLCLELFFGFFFSFSKFGECLMVIGIPTNDFLIR